MESLDPLHDLCLEIDQFLEHSDVGFFDGHEIAMDLSDGSLYFYGPNAETLFKTIKPRLENVEFLRGAEAILSFGSVSDENYKVIEVPIGE